MINYHRPTTGFVYRREKGVSGKVKRVCPDQFVEYNPSMSGTDSFGRRSLRYTCRRISKKWWSGFYYFCIDTAVLNGYCVYDFFYKICGLKIQHLSFSKYVQGIHEEGFKKPWLRRPIVLFQSRKVRYETDPLNFNNILSPTSLPSPISIYKIWMKHT